MNLSKELKKKRDAETRLNKQSPTPVFVAGGGESGGDVYYTEGDTLYQIKQVIATRLLAGDNITITDNEDGTYTISTEASVDLMFDGGSANSNDFTVTFDGGGA